MNTQASAISSEYKNSLLGFPLPQISTCEVLFIFASCIFLKSAGSTCDVSKSKLSFGPYKFVGITLIKLVPY